MMCCTFNMSTANCTTDKQFRSLLATTFAIFLWVKTSPGARSSIWLAGTRLSEHPIQRYFGVCWRPKRWKNPTSTLRIRADQARLLASNESMLTLVLRLRSSNRFLGPVWSLTTRFTPRSRPRLSAKELAIRPDVMVRVLLPQHRLLDLAGRGARQLIHEDHGFRALKRT